MLNQFVKSNPYIDIEKLENSGEIFREMANMFPFSQPATQLMQTEEQVAKHKRMMDQVLDICDERLRFNETMENFLISSVGDQEKFEFFDEFYGVHSIPNEKHKNKIEFLRTIIYQANKYTYQVARDAIRQDPQHLDAIYLYFCFEYKMVKKCGNSLQRNDLITEKSPELDYYNDIIALLAPHVSTAGQMAAKYVQVDVEKLYYEKLVLQVKIASKLARSSLVKLKQIDHHQISGQSKQQKKIY